MGSKCDVNLPGPVVDFRQKYFELVDIVDDLRERLAETSDRLDMTQQGLAEALKRITALEKNGFDSDQDLKILTKDEQRAIALKNYVEKNGAVSTKDAERFLKVNSRESARRAMIFCKDNFAGFYLTKTRRGVSVLRYKREVFE